MKAGKKGAVWRAGGRCERGNGDRAGGVGVGGRSVREPGRDGEGVGGKSESARRVAMLMWSEGVEG